jgi:hypothetical protein
MQRIGKRAAGKDQNLPLGFDAREMWLNFRSEWDDVRKREYLLRDDATRVLSTDSKVWPSIFQLERSLDRTEELPEYRHVSESLAELRRVAGGIMRKSNRPYSIIAIALMTETCSETEIAEWRKEYPEPEPLDVKSQWSFLGYDISDRFFLSGLSNCGYGQDRPALQREWAPCINEHHLVSEIDSANKFKIMTDERVKEHAPFYVFGIWLVES